MGKPDPLVAALKATGTQKCGRQLRIIELFGDRPDVLDAIRDARRRGVSCATIARTLSTPEQTVCSNSVDIWYRRHG